MEVPELVKVPAGKFLMGTTSEEAKKLFEESPEVERKLLEREVPQHEIYLDEYYIGKYPVTNREFALFVKETGYKTTAEKKGTGAVFTPGYKGDRGANWRNPFGPGSDIKDKTNHPVVQVSWYDAIEYCKWLSSKTRRKHKLPTEAEWEKAARGTDGRIFPWGNRWDPEIVNAEYRIKDTTPVGKFSPFSDSPCGCADMCGNVFEWTSTTTGSFDPWPSRYVYPYTSEDGREDPTLKTRRLSRGGSYSRGEVFCRTAFRFADPPADRYSAQGFRVSLEME